MRGENFIFFLASSGFFIGIIFSILHGFDFAVFENSFNDSFLELAFVEVSSDGINFVRFPATSNTQTDVQITGFGTIDPTYINNLVRTTTIICISNMLHIRMILPNIYY